jgi:hypothetical protein
VRSPRRPAAAGKRSLPRLDRTPDGIDAVWARVERPVYELSRDELATLGLDAERTAFLRRRRGCLFDSRVEQLTQARLLREVEYNHERSDALLEVITARELGRSILAACFGPANRAVLELYWDVIHELGADQLWLGDLTGIVAADPLTPSPGIFTLLSGPGRLMPGS